MRLEAKKKFFNSYRQHFGVLNQTQVDGLDRLLDALHADPNFLLQQKAYILATISHETADTFQPITEYGGDKRAERLYGFDTRVGHRLGNIFPGDGALFKGRGYVQLTGRRNYKVMGERLNLDLVSNPSLALDPIVSYRITTVGMLEGIFTGKSLGDYTSPNGLVDYVRARRIINGVDKAKHIARLAKKFEQILKGV